MFFFGIEHKLRGEARDQEWNAWAKKRHTIAAAGARSIQEVEDGNHTFRGVMVAVKKILVSVVDIAGGIAEGLEDDEGRIAQISVKCTGGLQVLAVFFGTRQAGPGDCEALCFL